MFMVRVMVRVRANGSPTHGAWAPSPGHHGSPGSPCYYSKLTSRCFWCCGYYCQESEKKNIAIQIMAHPNWGMHANFIHDAWRKEHCRILEHATFMTPAETGVCQPQTEWCFPSFAASLSPGSILNKKESLCLVPTFWYGIVFYNRSSYRSRRDLYCDIWFLST